MNPPPHPSIFSSPPPSHSPSYHRIIARPVPSYARSGPKNTRRSLAFAPRLYTSQKTRLRAPSNGIPKSRTSGNMLAHLFLRDHPSFMYLAKRFLPAEKRKRRPPFRVPLACRSKDYIIHSLIPSASELLRLLRVLCSSFFHNYISFIELRQFQGQFWFSCRLHL